MKSSEPQTETPQWKECVEELGKYRLPHGKTNLCGATENWGCPYLHPLQAFVKSENESRYVHLCNLKEADDGWKTFLSETNSRWDWLFEQLKQQNVKYDFRVTPMPAKNAKERSSFLKNFPLDNIVDTAYFRINDKKYGFISPASQNEYSVRTLRRIFRGAQKQGLRDVPTFLQIVSRQQYIPLSMEPATATPFPTEGELTSLENIFINDVKHLEGEKVVLPIGGKGSYARRVSMEMEYSAIYDILAAQVGKDKVKKVKFG